MEKVYRLLSWLDIGQAVDYLQDLTATNLTAADLLSLCTSRQCAAYTSVEGIAGFDSNHEVIGNGIHRVLSPQILIRAGTATTAELALEGPVFLTDSDDEEESFWAVWHANTSLRNCEALFKPADIQALAAKMNGAPEQLNQSELEDLRRQLREEKAKRKVEREHWQRLYQHQRSVEEHLTEQLNQAESVIEYARKHAAQAKAEAEAAEADPKPSHLLAIAALLELLKAPADRPRPQGMNQEAIKAAILEQFPWRGLSRRSLEDIFAAANKAKADAK